MKQSNLDEDGFEVAGPHKGALKIGNKNQQLQVKGNHFKQYMKK